MYVTAHHVRRRVPGQPDLEGVNAFAHLHGPDFPFPTEAARLPDEQPGVEVLALRDVTVPPGGNDVRSYLDVVAPDGTDVRAAEATIDQVRDALAVERLPLVVRHGGVTLRFGLQFGLYGVRREEFDGLAAKVLALWERVYRAQGG